MRIATHPEAIKHLVKIGMASDISEHIKMVESANESLIKKKDELRSVAEDNKRECEATRIENARLKAEVERLTAFTTRTIIPNEELQAQVERLTKAGDELYKSMLEIGCNEMADNFQYDAWFGSMKDWNAAKEGKQS